MSMREPKPFKCPHCVKSFANNSYLSQHMRIHLGIRAFGPCQFCGKKFTQLSHLQQHIRTHTGEKPYKCKFANCEKAFSQLSNLQSHSRCHQSDRPYKCNSCYKCFADEATLLDHIPKHKESKHLKVHICPYCGKSYTQALYLDKHMTKHADRRNDLRFPKTYYNGSVGDFMSDNSFEGLNSLGTLQNDELTLKFLQQQQQQFTNNATGSASTSYTNGSGSASSSGGSSNNNLIANAYNNISPSNFASSVTANSSMSMMNNMTNQMIGNFFQRSLRLGGTENSGLRTGSDRIASGFNMHNKEIFNMITPLENIKQFSSSSASSNAANFQ